MDRISCLRYIARSIERNYFWNYYYWYLSDLDREVLLIVAPYEFSLDSPKTGLSMSLRASALSFSLSSLSRRRFRGISKASCRALAPSTCGVGLRAEGTGDFSRYPVPTELTDPPLFGLLLERRKRKMKRNRMHCRLG